MKGYPIKTWTVSEFSCLWADELPSQPQLRQKILGLVWRAITSSAFQTKTPLSLHGTNDPELYLWYLRGGEPKLWERLGKQSLRRRPDTDHQRGTKLKEVKRRAMYRSELYIKGLDGSLGTIDSANVAYVIEQFGRRQLGNIQMSAFGIWRWLRTDDAIENLVRLSIAPPRFVQKYWPRLARGSANKLYSASKKKLRPAVMGRPLESSRLKSSDRAALIKMHGLLQTGKMPTVSAAAKHLAKAVDGQSEASNVRRLQRKYTAYLNK